MARTYKTRPGANVLDAARRIHDYDRQYHALRSKLATIRERRREAVADLHACFITEAVDAALGLPRRGAR